MVCTGVKLGFLH